MIQCLSGENDPNPIFNMDKSCAVTFGDTKQDTCDSAVADTREMPETEFINQMQMCSLLCR